MKAGEPYRCDMCGGTYLRTIDDEEAVAIARKQGMTDDPMAIVCEDCYYRIFGNTNNGEKNHEL